MRVAILILILIMPLWTFSQGGAYDGPTLIYGKQIYGGGQLNTSGWGILGYSGVYDGYYNVKLRGAEFVKLKHPREFKLPNNGNDNSRRFAYGKLNSFQTMRLMLGKKSIISDKLRHGAVAIGYTFLIGPSIGVLKPVFVEVSRTAGGTASVERYDPEIHDFSIISGRANFLHGLDKMKLAIGGVVKASILFEYSGENAGIQQLEVGASLDVFSREVPIMIEQANNQQFYPALFVSYAIGKKYNRR